MWWRSKSLEAENPTFEDLYTIGTVASIIRMLKMPDGSTTAIIQGKRRFELLELTQNEPYFKGSIKPLTEKISLKKTAKK